MSYYNLSQCHYIIILHILCSQEILRFLMITENLLIYISKFLSNVSLNLYE